ncbi:MAG: BatA domain-containing protein, partial [Planctomycetes bacterium]|nr:BatA domain-containing protein [Planctomycetota bacterium]
MTFLNATLIFGVVTVAVPIALHLLARREPRRVVFPSVQFLVQRFESNRSRLRVRRWWLLALRIAALALLALALARPAIHQSLSITWLTIGMIAAFGLVLLVMATVALSRGLSRSVAYGSAAAAGLALLAAALWGTITYATGPAPSIDSSEPVAIAIVMDNAPTSAWHTADDDRIARMKDVATWMVTRLPRTSRIGVLDRSSQVANFSLDASSAVAKIDQLQPLQLTQPIANRLEAAARLIRTSDLSNRQILLITDLAESTWNDAADAGLAAILSEDPAISLTVLDLGEFQGRNRSLSLPRPSDATPPKDSPVPITVDVSLPVAQPGDSASVTAELEMFDNDPSLPVIRDGVVVRPQVKAVDRASARVAAGGSSQLLLTIPGLPIGTHHGRIRLVGEDAMSLDDTRYFTLQVLPPSEVLLVGDDEDEARVIAQAITAGAIDPASAEFTVERIGYSDLSVVRLADFDVVTMLDPTPAALKDESIARFLAQGGGVLACLGPAAGGQPLQSSFSPHLVRRWRVPPPGSFFQVSETKHP